MISDAIPWRRAFAGILAAIVVCVGVVVVLRADGFSAVDATAPRATRWFVDPASGRIALADGFSGRTLARIDVGPDGSVLEVAQNGGVAAVVDRSAGTARSIDASALRIGPAQSLGLIAQAAAIVGVSQPGIIAVAPEGAEGLLVPAEGDSIPFDLVAAGAGDATRIAPDGGVWTFAAGTFARITTSTRDTYASGLTTARFTLVGNEPFLLDEQRSRTRFSDGDWVDLPGGVAVSEVVLQQTGPEDTCGWLATDDVLQCIGVNGVERSITVAGLDAAGGDMFAIGGRAGAIVHRSTSSLVRFDWRAGVVLDDVEANVPAGSTLRIWAAIDLVWVDQTNGDLVWAVHPWGLNVIRKDDSASPLLGDSGEVLEDGSAGAAGAAASPSEVVGSGDREPDNNGIDDPPVAVDDTVTARSGASVPIAVTANDFDPDGEAVALFSATEPSNGAVNIVSATTLTYLPSSGFVGTDQFEYTIVDGNGTEATATVRVQLLPTDAPNRAPVGSPDAAETGADTPVVIDVLINDVDPERDALRIGSFTPADVGGAIAEVPTPSGLPGLRYTPPAGASGTATFTYRPLDSFGATGDPVTVTIHIAQPTDVNRPPVVKPDAVRVRRDIAVTVPVLANDRDPDGDRLSVGLVEPIPRGLDLSVDGEQLVVVARAGAADLTPFAYSVDDGHGNVVNGSVLVVLVSDLEPNRPPVANADFATVVEGTPQTIDVLVNDSDPDFDPLILTDVAPGTGSAAGSVRIQGDRVLYTPAPNAADQDSSLDRFTYTISDGNGNEAIGTVAVRVLTERIAAPPSAQDDAATTEVDVPVTLEVLRNDVDPSGDQPTLVGTPGCPSGGSATVTADQRVTFTPPPGQSGVFRCTYEVVNSQGLRATASIVVSVIPPAVNNVAPLVVDEEVTVTIGETVVVDVLANDIDPDGSAASLRLLSSTTPVLGVAVRSGRTITFDAGSVAGVVTITYQVGDDAGGVSSGRLIIRIVEPVPQPPLAVADRRSIVGPGVRTVIDVVENDSDPDGTNAELTVRSATLLSGTATVGVGARSVVIVPDPAFVGDVVAQYVIVDADGLTSISTVTLTITAAPNRAPIARDDTADVLNGGSVTVPIALNDEDPDGDPLTFSITAPPVGNLGTAQIEGSSLVFSATPGSSGIAVIGYSVTDGELTATAVARINVQACTVGAPVAPDLNLSTGYQEPIFIDLTQSAINGTVINVGPPLNGPTGVYNPPAGENGVVQFSYSVRNTCGIVDVGMVSIDVNQAPLARPTTLQLGRNDIVDVPVSALASDGEPLVITSVSGDTGAVEVIDSNRALRISPAGRSGTLDVEVVVADPGGLQATVALTITLINQVPIAHPDAAEITNLPITIDVLANDTDPDGDSLVVTATPASITFSNGGSGTVEVLADQTVRVSPGSGAGTAIFTYVAVDALGAASTAAEVTVSANASPVAPLVVVTIPYQETVVVPVAATDPDNDPLTLTVEPSAQLGTFVDGLNVSITALPATPGSVIDLSYTVTDPGGRTATNVIRVTVDQPTTTTTVPDTTTTTLPDSTTTTTTTPTTTTTTTTTATTTTTTSP
ncbi:MAG TPA: Ig-like domain-containing protein [Ilumatobacter sp.]|nr:Ig-like domain-containing protein [Ilumatobacter sp.]